MTTERATLRTLLDSLGPGILEVIAAPAGLEVAVRQPVINDPDDPSPIDAGDLVLAIGTRPASPAAVMLVERAGRASAAAVVFRCTERVPESVVGAAAAAAVALLGVVPEMAWGQLHTLLRTAAAASGSGGEGAEAGGALGDLFNLANAIALRVGGPTTIEDPQSTVLAYSSLDEPIDEARRRTILGRRVPDEWLRRLHDDGVFRRLWREDGVVRVSYPDAVPEVRPRLAVGIRAGGEVLGSIWVAEDRKPLDTDAEEALLEASRLAALHLIRAQSGEDLERARRSTLLRSVLDGQSPAALLADALGVSADSFATVVGFRLPGSVATEIAVSARRACRLVDLYCESTRRAGSCVAMGPVVYTALVDPTEPGAGRIRAFASEMLSRGLPEGTIAGIGSTVAGLVGVAASREEADRVLAVLTDGGPPVASIADVQARAIVLRLRELAASEPFLVGGRLQALVDADRRAGSGRGHHLDTLRAYLDAFGDVGTAAAAVGVHPNTFRYRMRRLGEISGIDLTDPIERLVTHLQLHLRS